MAKVRELQVLENNISATTLGYLILDLMMIVAGVDSKRFDQVVETFAKWGIRHRVRVVDHEDA